IGRDGSRACPGRTSLEAGSGFWPAAGPAAVMDVRTRAIAAVAQATIRGTGTGISFEADHGSVSRAVRSGNRFGPVGRQPVANPALSSTHASSYARSRQDA